MLFFGLSEADKLFVYLEEMEFNDVSNREGHAAKVYFNAMFGKGFSRTDENPVNAALNYGYNIILACVYFSKNIYFFNLHLYFSDEELELFYSEILKRGIKILDIEGFSFEKNQSERITTVDVDFCEIIEFE